MSLQKESITVSLLIVLLFSIPTSVEARSVYAIPKHDFGEILNVYDILEGQMEGQLEYRAVSGQLSVIWADYRFILDMVRQMQYN